jgi:hypothetical protein
MKLSLNIILLLVTMNSNLALALSDEGSIGLGIGTPYAMTGVNLKVNIINSTFISLGLGDSENQTTYGIGVHQYLLSREHSWRPGIGLRYGTNSYLYYETFRNNPDEYSAWNWQSTGHDKHYSGFDFVLSQQVSFGLTHAHGLDFGVVCRLTDGGWRKNYNKYDGSPGGPDSTCWTPFLGYRVNY